jgi:hypothetical protein
MGAVDQLAVAPGATSLGPSRSRADLAMRRLLRVPDGRAVLDESDTHRIFSASIFLSALRCLLSYIILPVVLPAIGVARGVGPAIGIPVGLLALTFSGWPTTVNGGPSPPSTPSWAPWSWPSSSPTSSPS